jgi:glycyl-tRNA synthetase
MLAVLTHAFHVEKVNNEERVVMKLKPHIAPYQLMVTALNPAESNQREMVENLYHRLSPHFALKYESTGSIGRRYRRADEIGIPFCLTVDYDSPNEQMVTIRERDTMQQERIPATEIANYLISAMYKLE